MRGMRGTITFIIMFACLCFAEGEPLRGSNMYPKGWEVARYRGVSQDHNDRNRMNLAVALQTVSFPIIVQ